MITPSEMVISALKCLANCELESEGHIKHKIVNIFMRLGLMILGKKKMYELMK